MISRRKGVDTRWGEMQWGEKNDVGPSGEISNRTIRRAQGIETKTECALHFLISLITSFQGGWLGDCLQTGVFLRQRREGKKKINV